MKKLILAALAGVVWFAIADVGKSRNTSSNLFAPSTANSGLETTSFSSFLHQ